MPFYEAPSYHWCVGCGELVPKFPHKDGCKVKEKEDQDEEQISEISYRGF